ncbi:MAG: DUF4097 family beta strand repeat-containing protein [Candidatus Hodarchaeota archaeon]
MAQNYCGKCGNRLAPDSRFCEICGTRVKRRTFSRMPREKIQSQEPITKHPSESSRKVEHSVTPKPAYSSSAAVSSVPQSAKPQRPIYASESQKKSHAWIIIGIVIILLLAVCARSFASTTFSLFHDSQTYLGEKSFTIDSKEILDLQLDIENSAGDVTVTFVESPTLLDARIKVWGGEDADLADATSFSMKNNDQASIVEFNSANDQFWDFFDHSDFSYSLIIAIAREARTNIAIDVSSGDISLGIWSSTTLTGLNLETSSGDIMVDFGVNAILNGGEIDLSASSGDISLAWTDLIVEQNIDWDIKTSSGDVIMEMRQHRLPENQRTMDFDVEVSSGDVAIECALSPSVGLKLEGDVSSGHINLLGSRSPYESGNYTTALLRLDFDINVSSGDIVAFTSS